MNGKTKIVILASTTLMVMFILWQSGMFEPSLAVPDGPMAEDLRNVPKEKPVTRQQVIATLKSQVLQMMDAMYKEDLPRWADWVLPAAIEHAGADPVHVAAAGPALRSAR